MVIFGLLNPRGSTYMIMSFAIPTLLEHLLNEYVLSPLPDPIATLTIQAVNVVNGPPEAPPRIFSVHMDLLGNSSTCIHSSRHQSLVQWLGDCECEFPESRAGSSQQRIQRLQEVFFVAIERWVGEMESAVGGDGKIEFL